MEWFVPVPRDFQIQRSDPGIESPLPGTVPVIVPILCPLMPLSSELLRGFDEHDLVQDPFNEIFESIIPISS